MNVLVHCFTIKEQDFDHNLIMCVGFGGSLTFERTWYHITLSEVGSNLRKKKICTPMSITNRPNRFTRFIKFVINLRFRIVKKIVKLYKKSKKMSREGALVR